MITIRPSSERGHADHGWLDTRYSFSFADYYDPRHMGFRGLRVINEDIVHPGGGFPEHPHRDMEIITYILSGALEHKDSMGNGSVIRAGDVQRMTAGRGVAHSEFNPSQSEPVHLLQIWLLPAQRALPPEYEQKNFPMEDKCGRLLPLVAHNDMSGAMRINADASLYATVLDSGESVRHELAPGRHAWVQVARGSVTLNGVRIGAGDGAAVSNERRLELAAAESDKGLAEALVFDLA